MRWPGKIAAGSVSNEIVQHHDWFPTFLAMAGEPDIVEKLKKGYQAIGRTYKNHLDAYNLLPYLTCKEKTSPRKGFFYISDDGDILALRYDNWKVVFMEQRCKGTMQVWAEPFTRLRVPKIYNLRTDPYEFADVTSNSYYEWFIYHAYILYGAFALADKFAQTFKEFPIIQNPNTFTIDDAIKMMKDAAGGAGHGRKRKTGRRAMPRRPAGYIARPAVTLIKGAERMRAKSSSAEKRAIGRRTVEAVIWGMPAVNFGLMYQALLKATGDYNQSECRRHAPLSGSTTSRKVNR